MFRQPLEDCRCGFILAGANTALALYEQGGEMPLAMESTGHNQLGKFASGRARFLEVELIDWFKMHSGCHESSRYEKLIIPPSAIGTTMSQEPPELNSWAYPRQSWPNGYDRPQGHWKSGPFYQRYLYEEDVEPIGWRPTPTWTGSQEIILTYTPKPILNREWFIRIPATWVAFHGDGECRRYSSADELDRALRADEEMRAKLNLPSMPYKVYEE